MFKAQSFVWATTLWLLVMTQGQSATEPRFTVETVAQGLERPWAMAALPDGRFLVTERPGRLRIIGPEGLVEKPVAGVPEVAARGQGGMLDVAVHPNYSENGWIYLAYSGIRDGKAHTHIMRAKLKEHALVGQETLFTPPADQYTRGRVHFGCRIVFDGKGFIYFSIGDRGKMEHAQDLAMAHGKIHRLHEDGRIPKDNPFVGKEGALDSIWTLGNRNPQGLAFEPETNLLWSTEHGPRGGDELNIIRKGLNYGWPVITYGINYSGTPITDKTHQEGMEQPVIHWTPSIACCGMDFYRGDKFPAWKGDIFVTALAHQKLVRIELEGQKVTKQEMLLEKTGRIRDVLSAPDGFLYVVYDAPGKIVRLVPSKN